MSPFCEEMGLFDKGIIEEITKDEIKTVYKTRELKKMIPSDSFNTFEERKELIGHRGYEDEVDFSLSRSYIFDVNVKRYNDKVIQYEIIKYHGL